MDEGRTREEQLAAGYLEYRDRRFSRALDSEGFAHNGPQSVEFHVENGDLYCIPDTKADREGLHRLLQAFSREDVLCDLTGVVEMLTDEALVQVWPEDEAYGPALMQELNTDELPEGQFRLHLWLDLGWETALDNVRDILASGEEPWWPEAKGY